MRSRSLRHRSTVCNNCPDHLTLIVRVKKSCFYTPPSCWTMDRTVYLEDIDTKRVAAVNDDKGPSSSPPTTQPSSSSGSVKRQLTLADMFSGSQGKSTTEPSAKKLKLSVSGSTSASSRPPNGSKVFGVQKLNSIPFSMAAFQDSLTPDEKGLLKLECEVMGKSWRVIFFMWSTPACERSLINVFSRLKLLKDEIRKPYFIKLKQFLWEEGVRGAYDSPSTLKIYPARKTLKCSIWNLLKIMRLFVAAKNIYAWSNTPLGKVKVVILGQGEYE